MMLNNITMYLWIPQSPFFLFTLIDVFVEDYKSKTVKNYTALTQTKKYVRIVIYQLHVLNSLFNIHFISSKTCAQIYFVSKMLV